MRLEPCGGNPIISSISTIRNATSKHQMASPVLNQRTYRLTQIPAQACCEDVRRLFPSNTRETIQHLSIARSVGSSVYQVSTITFEKEPAFLASLPYKHGSLLTAHVPNIQEEYSHVWIDAHFHGFTRLNDLPNEREAVEYAIRCSSESQDRRSDQASIIALTGLGGKAFTSWQCHDGSMWLRDHLPSKLPDCRVAIYGYSSDVGNSDSVSTLPEMAEMFLLDLLNYRKLGSPGNDSKVSFNEILSDKCHSPSD